MTLTELFLPQTNQEFPPPHVFAYVGTNSTNAEVKSLLVKELPIYETMYYFSGTTLTEKSKMWNDPLQDFGLPQLMVKEVL